jgi:hypothetical protein
MNFSNEKKALKDALKDYPDLWSAFKEIGCMLAGGALTSIYRKKPIADFDLYFRSKEDLADLIEELESNKFVCMAKSDRSALFVAPKKTIHDNPDDNIKINLVYFKYFRELSEVFRYFDFTCCMCGYDFKTDCFDSHPDFYRDTLLENIVYSANSKYPLAALLRVQKYLKKGFKISKKEMIRIILHCQKNPIESMDDVADQVGSLYGTNIKEVIGEIEPFSIDAVIEKLSEVEDTNFEPEEKKILQIDWDIELFKDLYFIGDFGSNHFLCRSNKIIKAASYQDISNFADRSYKIEPPLYLYKHVRDIGNNRLCSFYRNSFQYVVGEEVSDSRTGVFCYLPEHLATGQYRRRAGSVAIEIRIDRQIDLWEKQAASSSGEIRIKKGTVTRIVPEGEYDGENSKVNNGHLDEQQQVLRYGRIGRTNSSEVRESWFIGDDTDLSDL